jgi:Mg2+/Co2+ transporter CorB
VYNDDRSQHSHSKLSDGDYKMLYFTTVYGFIYGAIIISFQQRYLIHKIDSLWVWVLILFISILLVFSAFYTQIYTVDNPDSFMNKFSYAIVPILPSLVILAESAISEVLDHSFSIQMQDEDLQNSSKEDFSGGNSDKDTEYWYVS